MTATPVKYVLDELEAVVNAQPAEHPLRRVDRDNSLVYEGGGAFDPAGAVKTQSHDTEAANHVSVGYVDRADEYIGTAPNLDIEEVVQVQITGLDAAEYGHIDPRGTDGVVFHGTDSSLVQQIIDRIYAGLERPAAGRTNVAFTHLSLQNHAPQAYRLADGYRYDVDVVFDGFETLGATSAGTDGVTTLDMPLNAEFVDDGSSTTTGTTLDMQLDSGFT